MTNKVVVTGHTRGVGQSIYQRFQSLNFGAVLGMSRSNGYDIDRDFDKVVTDADGAWLFVNNAYCGAQQLKLFHALKHKVSMMVVMGSTSRFYTDLIPTQYARDKQELAEACRLESTRPTGIPILHLDISFIEDTPVDVNSATSFTSDHTISRDTIVDSILFWTQHPDVRQIEFRCKLTPYLIQQLRRANPNLDPPILEI
jgi:hypothetical protein